MTTLPYLPMTAYTDEPDTVTSAKAEPVIPAYLQRMIAEQIRVNGLYVTLSAMLAKNVKPDDMSDLAWSLLRQQIVPMETYRDILLQRIDLCLREIKSNQE